MQAAVQNRLQVTRAQVVARGLTNRCPNCAERTLFPPGSLRVRPACPTCGATFDRGEGFFLGPWTLNYGVTVFGWVLPAIVLGINGVLSWGVALGIAGFGCLVLPILLYRPSWSWWLMICFLVSPEKLPANGGIGAGREEL